MPSIPGINHLEAVKALAKAGFYIARQGKHKYLDKSYAVFSAEARTLVEGAQNTLD